MIFSTDTVTGQWQPAGLTAQGNSSQATLLDTPAFAHHHIYRVVVSLKRLATETEGAYAVPTF